MRLLGRIVIIFLAFCLACLASGLTIAFGILGTALPAGDTDPVMHTIFLVAAFVGTTFTVTAAFLPLLGVIIVAEAFSLRSVIFYALAGIAIVVVAYYGSGLGNPYEESIDYPGPFTRGLQLALATGVVFGLTYWLFAGRRAGAWREPRP